MPTIIRVTALTLAIAVLAAACEGPFTSAGTPTVTDVADETTDLDPASPEVETPATGAADGSAPEPDVDGAMEQPATLSLRDVTDEALTCSAMVANLFLVAQQRIELARVAIPEMDEWALAYADGETETDFCALADEMTGVLFPE